METINLQNHKLERIRKAKEERYGDFDQNMVLIGRSWSVLLGLKNPIPGWLVSLMYCASKMVRTRKKYFADNYDDAENYLLQARIMQQKDHEGKG